MTLLDELFGQDGRVAVVTGASSGLGRAIAEALAAVGAAVVLVARDRGRLDAVAAGIGSRGGRGAIVAADLADRDAVARCADAGPAAVRRTGHPGQRCRHQPATAARPAGDRRLGPDAGRQPDRAVPARAGAGAGDARPGLGPRDQRDLDAGGARVRPQRRVRRLQGGSRAALAGAGRGVVGARGQLQLAGARFLRRRR